jgi:hypothetical protein
MLFFVFWVFFFYLIDRVKGWFISNSEVKYKSYIKATSANNGMLIGNIISTGFLSFLFALFFYYFIKVILEP